MVEEAPQGFSLERFWIVDGEFCAILVPGGVGVRAFQRTTKGLSAYVSCCLNTQIKEDRQVKLGRKVEYRLSLMGHRFPSEWRSKIGSGRHPCGFSFLDRFTGERQVILNLERGLSA